MPVDLVKEKRRLDGEKRTNGRKQRKDEKLLLKSDECLTRMVEAYEVEI